MAPLLASTNEAQLDAAIPLPLTPHKSKSSKRELPVIRKLQIDVQVSADGSLTRTEHVIWTGPFEKLLGYTSEDVEPSEQWWSSKIHDEDRDRIIKSYHQILQNVSGNVFASENRIWGVDYRIKCANGLYMPVSERAIIDRKPTGEAFCVESVIFCQESRQTQRDVYTARLESQNHLDLIANHTDSAIYIMDPQGYCQYMNAAAERITGFTFEEIKDWTFHESVHSCTPSGTPYPIDECPIFLHHLHGTAVRNGSETFVHKNGTFFEIEYSVSPIGDYSSGGAIIEFRDVTEQKKLERERIEILRLADQQAGQIKADELHKTNMTSFVSFVCHELRNPLQGVTASVEFLNHALDQLDSKLDSMASSVNGGPASDNGVQNILAQCREFVHNIQACADHQALITNNVLDLSRLDAGKVEVHLQPTDIDALGSQVIEMLSARAHKKQIRLEFDAAQIPSTPRLILADATLLRQVLLNLVSNAIKFTPSSGTIHISLDTELTAFDGNIILRGSVKDPGIGMSEQEQLGLFQRFSQQNRRVAQLYGGSGLGLNICKEIVDVMGGKMSVKSARGEGSTFSFTSQHKLPSQDELLRFRNSSPPPSVSSPPPQARPTTPFNKAAEPKLDRGISLPANGGQDSSIDARVSRLDMNDSSSISELSSHLSADQPLPAIRGTSPSPRVPFSDARPSKFGLIGVAEDNPINRKYLCKHLDMLGYRYLAYENGLEVLNAFCDPDIPIDCCILDMSMPVMDGLVAARQIRKFEDEMKIQHALNGVTYHPKPLIALSGNALAEQVEDAFDAGLSDYMSKPCKQADLRTVLNHWEAIVHDDKEHTPLLINARRTKKT